MFHTLGSPHFQLPHSRPPQDYHHLSSGPMHALDDKKLPPLQHAIPASFRPSVDQRPSSIANEPRRDSLGREPLHLSHLLNSGFAAEQHQSYKHEQRHDLPSMMQGHQLRGLDGGAAKASTYDTRDSYMHSRPPPQSQTKPPISRHGSTGGAPDMRDVPWGTSSHGAEDCKGCISIRPTAQEIISSLLILEMEVQSVTSASVAFASSSRAPEVARDGTLKALQWVHETIQANTNAIRRWKDEAGRQKPSTDASLNFTSASAKRKHESGEFDGVDHPKRHRSSDLSQPFDDTARNHYHMDSIHGAHSPRRTASSGSITMPIQSPRQNAPRHLPSPSPTNFSSAQPATRTPPPATSMQTSAQSAHLQELQHQVSIKTLALQTLQREYDSLIQKLERQRTKCATLEKKFEVSDAEINSLTDEKERLQGQIANLEAQVDELQASRDEARQQSVANGGQYIKIMEMASRLQAQGAAEKKKWEQEKEVLLQRLSASGRDADAEAAGSRAVASTEAAPEASTAAPAPTNPNAPETKTEDASQEDKGPAPMVQNPRPNAIPATEDADTAAPAATSTSHSVVPQAVALELHALLYEGQTLENMGRTLLQKGADLRMLVQKVHGTLPVKQSDAAPQETVQAIEAQDASGAE